MELGLYPPVISHPGRSEIASICRRRASQKNGIEFPIKAKIRVAWSGNLSFRNAETVPVGMPTSVAHTVAVLAGSAVCGKKMAMAWVTGMPPLIAEVVNPQSPVRSLRLSEEC